MMKHVHQWVPRGELQRYECDYVECGAALDYGNKPTRKPGIYDAYPEDPTLTRDVNFWTELGTIGIQVGAAFSALADEHEGNFKEAVRLISVHAQILERAVKDM